MIIMAACKLNGENSKKSLFRTAPAAAFSSHPSPGQMTRVAGWRKYPKPRRRARERRGWLSTRAHMRMRPSPLRSGPAEENQKTRAAVCYGRKRIRTGAARGRGSNSLLLKHSPFEPAQLFWGAFAIIRRSRGAIARDRQRRPLRCKSTAGA